MEFLKIFYKVLNIMDFVYKILSLDLKNIKKIKFKDVFQNIENCLRIFFRKSRILFFFKYFFFFEDHVDS